MSAVTICAAAIVAVTMAGCGDLPQTPADGASLVDFPSNDDTTDATDDLDASQGDSAPGDTSHPPTDTTPTAGPALCPPLRPADPLDLHPATCVLDVRFDLPAPAWDTLRAETRTLVDILAGDCLASPPRDVFTWFEANLTLNGRIFPRVGLRKKGFLGSLSEDRPSLRVALDRFNPTQRAANTNRLVFNNMRQDPGIINTCLAYDFLRDAGLPAPRCSFARINVNGRDLGLYAHVEPIGDSFLQQHFSGAGGRLYEATLSDFRTEFRNTWERKDFDGPDALVDIDRVITALAATEPTDDAGLLATLAPIVDLAAFFRHWAAESLLGHWDGYAGNTNNTWLYRDPADGLLHLIPWGMDAVFGADPWPEREGVIATGLYADGVLAHRLWASATGRAAFQSALRDLLASHWNETHLLGRIDVFETLLLPHVSDDAGRRFEFQRSLQMKRAFVLGRRAALAPLLADNAPTWPLPLKEPFCWSTIGSLVATFDTTWNTSGWNPLLQKGTLLVTLPGRTLEPGNVTANARTEPNENPDDLRERARIEILGQVAPGLIQAVAVVLPQMSVAAGTIVPLDWQAAEGFVGLFDTTAQSFELQGLAVGGTLVFETAFPVAGESVRGRIESPIVEGP